MYIIKIISGLNLMLRNLQTVSFAVLLLLSQWSYSATEVPKEAYTDILPDYCNYTWNAPGSKTDPSTAKIWSQRLGGDGFIHTHHYCWGLYDVYLAHKSLEKASREGYLGEAIKEFHYVQTNSPETYKLLPKISYEEGQLREELGDLAGATRAYYESIRLNPKIARPYAALSDLFKKLNNTKDALEILEQGLKYKPKSKLLLKRVALLSKEK
jgi:tetratricopeptide (TPR) repeat protein